VGVNPANGDVYVTCEEKGEVFAIDPDAQRVIAQIETGGRPRSVAFPLDGSRAYVACENGGYVAVIDAKSHKLLSKIQLPTGSLPMGTAISRDGKELYVSTGRGNAVAIIDTQNIIAQGSPLPARGDGEGEESIATTREGRLSSSHEERGKGEESIIAMIPVGNRAWGIALDPSGSKLYTANGASNDVSVVDLKSRKELRRIKVGDGPWGIAIVSRK
jgi:YVTN family beta-propeller protein